MKPALFLIPLLAVLALVFLRNGGSDGPADSLTPGVSVAQAPAVEASEPEAELSAANLSAGQKPAATRDLAPASEPAQDAAPAAPAALDGPFGRVVSLAGVPQAGAEVELRAAQGNGILQLGQRATRHQATTAADGTFRLPALANGVDHEVVVRQAGYATFTASADRNDLGELVLEPGLIVRGTVLDFRGDPVADARVLRSNAEDSTRLGMLLLDDQRLSSLGDRMFGSHLALTDSEGRFELPFESAGEIELTVAHTNHPRHVHRATGQVGDTLEESVMLPESATIAGMLEGRNPENPGTIEVLARRRGTDAAPRTFSRSSFGSNAERRVEVQPDGSFVLAGLQAGSTYTVWAGQTDTNRFRPEACSTEVVAVAGEANVKLSYRSGAQLSFSVIDAKTGEAIDALTISHSWATGGKGGFTLPNRRQRTYPGGEVVLASLRPDSPPAVLEVTVAASGYRSVELNPSIPAEGEVSLGQIQMTPTATLSVRVETADGQPIEGASVQLSTRPGSSFSSIRSSGSPGGEARSISVSFTSSGDSDEMPDIDEMLHGRSDSIQGKTDGDGLCELAVPDERTATLTVSAKGYATWTEEDLTMPKTGTAEHVTVLNSGGGVQLSVVTSDGEPAGSVRIEHHGERRKYTSDDDGQLEFENLPAGLHHFRLAAKESGGMVILALAEAASDSAEDMADWTPVLVSEGAIARATLTQSPRGTLSGTVTSQGEPLRRARLKLAAAREDLSPQERALRGAMDSLSLGGSGGLSDRSGRKGEYSIEEVDVGLYTLSVTHADWAMPQEFEIRVGEGSNKLDVELPMCILRGKVVNTQGEPVEGAEVSVREDDGNQSQVRIGFSINGAGGLSNPGTVLTGSDGRYELRGIGQGVDLIVEAKGAGMAPTLLETPEMYADESRSRVDLVLERGARLTVQLDDSASPDATVIARPSQGQPMIQRAADRSATFDGMSPGEWTISILAMGEDQATLAPETVTLAAEEVRSLVLDGTPDE